jgi:hypothetical protein
LAPDYGLAYQNKAWLLAACDDSQLRDGKQAILVATTACKISQYKDLGAVKALAAAFAEDGQYDKAIGWQEKVVEAAGEDQRPFERKILEEYQANKPFRLEREKAVERGE